MKQEPKILRSDITDDYYLVTSYDKIGEHQYRAKKKICITTQLKEAGLI